MSTEEPVHKVSNDFSPQWIAAELKHQKKKVRDLEKAYDSIGNKNTQYAKGISKMVQVRKDIIGVLIGHTTNQK